MILNSVWVVGVNMRLGNLRIFFRASSAEHLVAGPGGRILLACCQCLRGRAGTPTLCTRELEHPQLAAKYVQGKDPYAYNSPRKNCGCPGSSYRFFTGYRGSAHSHGSLEIFYVLSGELTHRVEGVGAEMRPNGTIADRWLTPHEKDQDCPITAGPTTTTARF